MTVGQSRKSPTYNEAAPASTHRPDSLDHENDATCMPTNYAHGCLCLCTAWLPGLRPPAYISMDIDMLSWFIWSRSCIARGPSIMPQPTLCCQPGRRRCTRHNCCVMPMHRRGSCRPMPGSSPRHAHTSTHTWLELQAAAASRHQRPTPLGSPMRRPWPAWRADDHPARHGAGGAWCGSRPYCTLPVLTCLSPRTISPLQAATTI